MAPLSKPLSVSRVLTCCDSFKGTLSACDAGVAIERAFRSVEKGGSEHAEFVHCPMSDGGDGLLDSLLFSSQSRVSSPYNFTRVDVPVVGTTDVSNVAPPLVVGPLGEPLNYGGSNYTPYFACDVEKRAVVIEMALESGLPMVPENKRDPLRTTSHGVGQIIRYAIEYFASVRRRKDGANADCGVTVFLGIGGSATNDGGLGALQALGVNMYVRGADKDKVHLLHTPFTGADLGRLARVELTPEFKQMFCSSPAGENKGRNSNNSNAYCKEVRLICDVANPLVGRDGATMIFGPQKCNPAWEPERRSRVLHQLETGMANAAAEVVNSDLHGKTGTEEQRKKHLDALLHTPGGGGAGGMSGFIRYVLRAKWTTGTDVVAELLGLQSKLRRCDCVITGEGSFDQQTIRFNKALGRLLQMVVMENVRRRGAGEKVLSDAVVVCGRSSYRGAGEVERELLAHMRRREGGGAGPLAESIPRVHLLALTPQHFSTADALGRAGDCVQERVRRFLVGEERTEAAGAAAPSSSAKLMVSSHL